MAVTPAPCRLLHCSVDSKIVGGLGEVTDTYPGSILLPLAMSTYMAA